MTTPALPSNITAPEVALPKGWTWEVKPHWLASQNRWLMALAHSAGDVWPLGYSESGGWVCYTGPDRFCEPLLRYEGDEVPHYYPLHSVLYALDEWNWRRDLSKSQSNPHRS